MKYILNLHQHSLVGNYKGITTFLSNHDAGQQVKKPKESMWERIIGFGSPFINILE